MRKYIHITCISAKEITQHFAQIRKLAQEPANYGQRSLFAMLDENEELLSLNIVRNPKDGLSLKVRRKKANLNPDYLEALLRQSEN